MQYLGWCAAAIILLAAMWLLIEAQPLSVSATMAENRSDLISARTRVTALESEVSNLRISIAKLPRYCQS